MNNFIQSNKYDYHYYSDQQKNARYIQISLFSFPPEMNG